MSLGYLSISETFQYACGVVRFICVPLLVATLKYFLDKYDKIMKFFRHISQNKVVSQTFSFFLRLDNYTSVYRKLNVISFVFQLSTKSTLA